MTTNKKVLVFESSYTLTNFLIKAWMQRANQAIQRRNVFTVALSGGKTPLEFYSRLSNLKNFDLWKQTQIFQADERFVPMGDSSHNFSMISSNLLQYVNIPPVNVHPINTDFPNVTIAADQYKRELIDFFGLRQNQLPIFDLVFLGIGEDGHTASLFPQEKDIDREGRLTIPVSLNHLKEERISMSLSVINQARCVMVLVLGQNKADIIERVLENKEDLPVTRVAPKDGELIFLLDKEAASRLIRRHSYSHYEDGILLEV